MSKLVWDQVGERYYETGTKNGVLYPQNAQGEYPLGVAWSGLTGVTESPSGGVGQPQGDAHPGLRCHPAEGVLAHEVGVGGVLSRAPEGGGGDGIDRDKACWIRNVGDHTEDHRAGRRRVLGAGVAPEGDGQLVDTHPSLMYATSGSMLPHGIIPRAIMSRPVS